MVMSAKKRAQDSQDASRQPQERSKSGPRASKSAPRAPQKAPRTAQERPKTPQRALKTPFWGSRARKKRHWEAICRGTWSRSKSGTIFNQILKHTRKRRTLILHDPPMFFIDFSIIRASSPSLCACAEKHRKSTKIHSPD